MEFHALGGVLVTAAGVEVGLGGPRQRRLLAMLLVHRGTVVSTDRLAEAVFAGEPTPAAATTLRSYIARIRRVVQVDGSPAEVLTRPPGYVLRVPDDCYDVARFEAGLAAGRRLLAQGDAAGAAATLATALAGWRGPAFAEFADEDWVRPEAQRLDELRLVALELRFEAELAAGRTSHVVAEVEAAVAAHPLREGFVASLMLALHRSGRQADALRAFQQHRSVLVEELGLEPSPALRRLEERVLAHDPELLVAASAAEALRGYRLHERLGRGRDGTVHAALLPGVERELVIRTYRPEVADDPAFVRAFEADARRLAGLAHRAVVPIHDHWREPGAAHLVLRRLRGGSLADRLERADRPAPTRAEVVAMVERLGSALVEARRAGIGHGRLGPRSVLFDEAGAAWLDDFDLGGRRAPSPAEDGRALVALARSCLPDAAEALAGLLAAEEPSLEAQVERLLAVLADDDALAPPAPVNPYKGLRAFDEVDAADFFGREALVDQITDRLERPDGRLVLVVGGSGTGKSSVVRAGVVPRVRATGRGWFVTTMLPGSAPHEELAAALRRVAVVEVDDLAGRLGADGGIDATVRQVLPPGGELLLVVDQLEELFTSVAEGEQRRFLAGLVHAVTAADSRVRVLATLRADFYDRPLAVQPFGALVNDATVTVPAMSAADLEASIVEPARRAGRRVEGRLVAELLAAALDEPAALPALQFTLFELAERSPGDLTSADHRQLGGVSGAIATRAEALHRSLDDEDRAAVRRLFGQLVVVQVDGDPTRRPAARTELTGEDPRLDRLVDRWVEARLLSVDRHPQSRVPTVELAHEALLREWPRLRRWIDEDRDALVVAGRLRDAAATWVELDRDPGTLYRGARLEVALDAVATTSLGTRERDFLDASCEARDREAAAVASEAARQARANRRLRLQLVAIAVALVVALAGGVLAIDQRAEAEDERRLAFARELATAADVSLEEDPERSLLLALEAIERTRDGGSALPEAVGALHEAISRTRTLLRVDGVGGNLDWSPDGSFFVTEGPEDSGVVDLRDAGTGASIRSWVGHEVDVNEVAVGPAGDLVATAGDDGFVRVWDVATGEEVESLVDRGSSIAWAVAFSPDGRFLAATWLRPDGGRVRVHDLETGRLVSTVERVQPFGVDFSPDGSRLVVPSLEEAGLVVTEVATGREVLRFGEASGTSRDARFSPDGSRIASTHADGAMRVWDAATGDLLLTVGGHTSEANAVDWSADGRRIATGGNDGTARAYELIDGGVRPLATVSARDTANGIGAVAFSPDGERLMTGDWAVAAVRVWDLSEQAGAELATMSSPLFRLPPDTFSTDGRHVALLERGGQLVRWDVEARAAAPAPAPAGVTGDVLAVTPSPDGELLVVDAEDGLSLHDQRSGRRVRTLPTVEEGWVTDVAWSRDGRHLAYAEADEGAGRGRMTVVDRSGATVAELVEEPDHFVRRVAFAAGGDVLAVARALPRQTPTAVGLQLWDWREGVPVHDVGRLAVDVAGDPASDRIAFAVELEGGVEIRHARTGELLRTLRADGPVYGVSWSPDGRRLALAGADGTVRVHDAGDGRLEVILRGHTRAVQSTAFSPDGTRLISNADGEEVRVWTLDLDELVALATARLTRSLEDDECRQYLRQPACEAPPG